MDHIPVMASEILEVFAPVPDGIFIDATFGLGGHSAVIQKNLGSKFQIIGLDRDAEILKLASRNLPEGVNLRNMRFSELPTMIEREKIGPVSGVLFDLGLNSAQLDDSTRGFSFSLPGPADMRFDRSQGQSAADVLADADEKELILIFKRHGQERNSRAIARAIVRERPNTTDALASLIKKVVGPQRFIKSAARIFQALRIYINRELDELKTALGGVAPLVATGGRLAVISYHSLEDGIVKRQFLHDSGKCLCGPNLPICVCGKRTLLKILTKKPITASIQEIRSNPRARAAKLRYAEKI
jgi:16S rRNA (cytosine1402-N4)-methyltransferase